MPRPVRPAWGICAVTYTLLALCVSAQPPSADRDAVSYLKQHPRRPIFYADTTINAQRELLSQCTAHVRNTTLDHFSWATPSLGVDTFPQRYFLCRHHWRRTTDGRPGPIFFYLGNEADVTLYLNATGLMWEAAHDFGALLLFAEHRYYGLSKPYPPKELRKHMQYLSSHQAMADYAELLHAVKKDLGAEDAPVIGFGGSYGGMLAAWMRCAVELAIVGCTHNSPQDQVSPHAGWCNRCVCAYLDVLRRASQVVSCVHG